MTVLLCFGRTDCTRRQFLALLGPELGAEMPASMVHLFLGEAGLLKGTIIRTRRDSEEP